VHIFSISKLGLSREDIGEEVEEEWKKGTDSAKNHKHMFKFMKWISKYFDSEWSFAKFWVTDSRTLCTFDKDENLIVISAEGTYYRASIDHDNGGDCRKLVEKKILQDSK